MRERKLSILAGRTVKYFPQNWPITPRVLTERYNKRRKSTEFIIAIVWGNGIIRIEKTTEVITIFWVKETIRKWKTTKLFGSFGAKETIRRVYTTEIIARWGGKETIIERKNYRIYCYIWRYTNVYFNILSYRNLFLDLELWKQFEQVK